jgi:hypothetical protein
VAMPPQLARSNRRRDRHSEPRPTIELMPAININALRHVIPRYHGQINEPNVSFKYPDLAYLRLSTSCLEVMGRNGCAQRFRIVWVRTGLGRPRAILVCSCGYGAIRLFARYGRYACKACHRAVHMCQRQSSWGRKRLRACKLRLELGGWPDVNEAIAPRAKWRHRRTYQRLRGQVQALETAIGSKRFRKPLDMRIFAYQVS